MHETVDAKATTIGRILYDNLRQPSVIVGGVAAGLVLVGLAVYTLGSVKSTASLGTSACEAQPISIVLGQNVEATMTVSPRSRCEIATGFATASIEDFSIIDPPKHGTVMQRGGAGVFYQSAGNFRGRDSFAFTVRGKTVDAYDGAASGTSVIRAHVIVK